MQMVDDIPESVYRVCDLLAVVTRRNGDQWRDDIVNYLLKEVSHPAISVQSC